MKRFSERQSLETDSFTACLGSQGSKYSLRVSARAGRHEKCVGGVLGTVPSLVPALQGKGAGRVPRGGFSKSPGWSCSRSSPFTLSPVKRMLSLRAKDADILVGWPASPVWSQLVIRLFEMQELICGPKDCPWGPRWV